MPGVPRLDPAAAVDHVAARCQRGISRFLVFGVPAEKGLDRAVGSDAVVPRFLTGARERLGDTVTLIADVGLSPYTTDGHSVVMDSDGIDTAASYLAAGQLAVAFAAAGADLVAPCLSLLLAAEHGGMDTADLFDEYHAAVERSGADFVIGYAGDQFLRR